MVIRGHQGLVGRGEVEAHDVANFSTKSGSLDSWKVVARCGCRAKARQIRLTVLWLSPAFAAIPRVLQCVASRGVVSAVRVRTRSTSWSSTPPRRSRARLIQQAQSRTQIQTVLSQSTSDSGHWVPGPGYCRCPGSRVQAREVAGEPSVRHPPPAPLVRAVLLSDCERRPPSLPTALRSRRRPLTGLVARSVLRTTPSEFASNRLRSGIPDLRS